MTDSNQITNDTHQLSDEKWIAIVEEWRQSGLSMKEWCRKHEEITYSQFMHNRRRLFPEEIRPNDFMSQETGWSALTMELPTSSLEVIINDCRVVVTPGFDQDLLSEVVGVLKNAH
ncbi:MAG TPA: hypothetical protein VFK37_05130 [Bacillales bacterium]|nr:hypothetical protein [Bacillales bacterium]